ncbi:transposase [Streptomyces nigrescens]
MSRGRATAGTLGRAGPARAASRDVPPHPRSALLPRLLLGRRPHPLGRQPPQEGSREHPGRPDDASIYVILDNLSAHKGADIRRWAKKNKVNLCFTPTYASWARRASAGAASLSKSQPDPARRSPHGHDTSFGCASSTSAARGFLRRRRPQAHNLPHQSGHRRSR